MSIFGKKETAVETVEPTYMETYEGTAYCVKCKEIRDMMNGVVKVSDSGRRMAMGICPVCNTKLNRILGKQPVTPQPEPTPLDISGMPATWVIASQIGDPNNIHTNAMAGRVLKLLLEIDPEMDKKIERWDDQRVEKKLHKKWRKKIGKEIADEIALMNLDVLVADSPLLLEAIVNVKKEAIEIAKGKQ